MVVYCFLFITPPMEFWGVHWFYHVFSYLSADLDYDLTIYIRLT